MEMELASNMEAEPMRLSAKFVPFFIELVGEGWFVGALPLGFTFLGNNFRF